jgi:copper(I)-binding protein
MFTSAARSLAGFRSKTHQFAPFIAVLILAACGQASMRVENPRTLPAALGSNAAVYFTVGNLTFTDDTLLGASSDETASLEIHRSALIKPADRAEMEAGGAYHYEAEDAQDEEDKSEMAAEEVSMDMAALASLQIKSGHEIEFEPGYYHLMLIDIKKDLGAGDQFTVILHFEKAGDVVVNVQVVENLD